MNKQNNQLPRTRTKTTKMKKMKKMKKMNKMNKMKKKNKMKKMKTMTKPKIRQQAKSKQLNIIKNELFEQKQNKKSQQLSQKFQYLNQNQIQRK